MSADSIYLIGDFNYPLIHWAQLSSSCHTSTEFCNLTLDYNLFQTFNQPTRETNILDLVLKTAPKTIREVTHLDGFSNHHLLQLSLDIPVAFMGYVTKIIYDYNKANFTAIYTELESFFYKEFLPSFKRRSIEENWILFND